jgi:hypothetical protein
MTSEIAPSASQIVRPITLFGIAIPVVALHTVTTLLLNGGRVPLVARLGGAIATSSDLTAAHPRGRSGPPLSRERDLG